MRISMWCLTIRIKKNDRLDGKPLYRAILDFMMKAKISGATVVNAVDGFGRRGRSTIHVEGVSINYPLIIEVVDEQSKLEPLLPEIKMMIGDNGVFTVHEVYSY